MLTTKKKPSSAWRRERGPKDEYEQKRKQKEGQMFEVRQRGEKKIIEEKQEEGERDEEG